MPVFSNETSPFLNLLEVFVSLRLNFDMISLMSANMKENLGLYETFREAAKKYSDKAALCYFKTETTFSQLLERVDTAALAFRKHGVKRGDIISLALPSMPESLMCFLALNKIGAIPCMIDVRYTPEEFCKIVDRTHSKMIFVMGCSPYSMGLMSVYGTAFVATPPSTVFLCTNP